MTLGDDRRLRHLRREHHADDAAVPRRDAPAVRGGPRRGARAAVHRRSVPRSSGRRGRHIHAQRVALIHDSRDSLTTPTEGLYISMFAEASTELLGSDADYVKAGVEGIWLKPFLDRRVVFVARGLFEGTSGESDTPFQVLPTLGGVDTLRGFGENRFYGDARLALQRRGAGQGAPHARLRRERGVRGRAVRRRRQGVQLGGAVHRHAASRSLPAWASGGWRRRASWATSSSPTAARGPRSTWASTTPSEALGGAMKRARHRRDRLHREPRRAGPGRGRRRPSACSRAPGATGAPWPISRSRS